VNVLPPLLVASVTFVGAAVLLAHRQRQWLGRRVGVRPSAAPAADSVGGGARVLRARLGRPLTATEARLSGSAPWRALDRLVSRAAIPLRTVELLYACLGTAIASAVIVIAAGGSPVVALVLALLEVAGVRVAVGLRAGRRLRAFDGQLPELLTSLASALRAGHSFLQAFQAIAREAEEPAAGEFKRALAEARLGRPIEDALSDLTHRIESKELEFVLDAVVIQRQVGGSLAGIFDLVADALRERQQFLLRLRALTAMGRMSSTVLLGMPIAVCLLLTALNPDYMRPLYATPVGHQLLIVAVVLMLLGWAWLRRIVNFRG
jgi:tight adherence protein B